MTKRNALVRTVIMAGFVVCVPLCADAGVISGSVFELGRPRGKADVTVTSFVDRQCVALAEKKERTKAEADQVAACRKESARVTTTRRLERLCRYTGRPPLALKRLSLLPDGRLLYRLKRRWRNGTTHVVFEPLELIEKLAALVPPPRFNLVRYH